MKTFLLMLMTAMASVSVVAAPPVATNNTTHNPAGVALVGGKISEQQAIRAIIGEAAGEPLQTKLAIAGALRNRGTLDGVRGLRNARMIDAQPAWVWRDARSAWSQSRTNDLSHGGTFFESVNFPVPAWAVGMHVTATVGKFRFYKP